MRFKRTPLYLMLIIPLMIVSGCSNKVTLPKEVTTDGDHLEIILEENPTTGYSWALDAYDTDVLKLEKDAYTASSTSESAVGSGGTHSFDFIGQKEGKTTLIFRYYRSWENKDTALEVKEYVVSVEEGGKIRSVEEN